MYCQKKSSKVKQITLKKCEIINSLNEKIEEKNTPINYYCLV
jgi:hypothetical protein